MLDQSNIINDNELPFFDTNETCDTNLVIQSESFQNKQLTLVEHEVIPDMIQLDGVNSEKKGYNSRKLTKEIKHPFDFKRYQYILPELVQMFHV